MSNYKFKGEYNMAILSEKEILEKLRELNVFSVRDELDQLSEEAEQANKCWNEITREINNLIFQKDKLSSDSPQRIDIDIQLSRLRTERIPYDNALENIRKRKASWDKKRIEIEKKTLEIINDAKNSVENEEVFVQTYPSLAAAEKKLKASLSDANTEDMNTKKESETILGIDAQTSNEIQTLLTNGQKIEAIKIYMEKTGVGLADAKNIIESLNTQPSSNNLQNNTTPAPTTDTPNSGGPLGTVIAIAIFVVFFLLLFGKYLF